MADRHLVGWLCPSRPDGPLIPPNRLTDPCGRDRAVYSDGTMDPAETACAERPTEPQDSGSYGTSPTTR